MVDDTCFIKKFILIYTLYFYRFQHFLLNFYLLLVNSYIFNLFPIPALDGGRALFLVLTVIIEKITRKKLDPKYEGYIHAAGMVLLLGLMAVILFKDVFQLFLWGITYDTANFGWKCAHRRRCPGGDPVHAQYKNDGCGRLPGTALCA